MIRVQVSVPFPAAMIDRVKDPFALPRLLLGALGFLQTGALDASRTVRWLLWASFWSRLVAALFGLLRAQEVCQVVDRWGTSWFGSLLTKGNAIGGPLARTRHDRKGK